MAELTTACVQGGGYGSIEGASGTLSLSTNWLCVTDWTSAWTAGSKRGSDRVLPGLDGVIAFRRRLAAATFDLPFIVIGGYLWSGAAATDLDSARAYLAQNIAHLFDEVFPNPATPDGQRLMSISTPGGALNRTAYVHVLGVDVGERAEGFDIKDGAPQAASLGTLTFSIADGVFV